LNAKGDFVGQLFDVWPPSARAQRCRELASAASAKAQHTKDSELRAEYLRRATVLQALALELEALRHRTQLESSQIWPRETVKKVEPIS
jgi:hypothetical protein